MPRSHSPEAGPPSPLARNLRLFLLFRLFFNARYYYPVYAILFFDFGLSVQQFATLNFAWAISIVVLEVPSGALADQFGRRTLVVIAAALMVVEMAVLCATPVGGGSLVFWMFFANRLLSGAAEAAASGADEALAYDSIPEESREKVWPALMTRLMQVQAIGFIAVTIIGAAVYDSGLVNAAVRNLGGSIQFDPATTLKFPLYLTLLHGLITLAVSLRMREPPRDAEEIRGDGGRIAKAFRDTLKAGAWILRTPPALVLILIGLFYDSIIRLFYTINSSYYRLIQIDVAWFGIIGAVASLVGFVAAFAVEKLADQRSPSFNFRLVTLLIFAGLLSLAFPIPIYGVIFVAPFWIAMRYLHFFVSYYLNRVTDSAHRATILSFRGLSMNLAYGLITLLFGLQTGLLKNNVRAETTGLAPLSESALDQAALAKSLAWWPVWFAAVVAGLVIFVRVRYRASLSEIIRRDDSKTPHSP